MRTVTEVQLSREQALDHAWKWFALHARQRMHCFNHFLVASTFLLAAYGTLLKDRPKASLVAGLLGAWISWWFTRLERRTTQLVHAGEHALRPFQHELAVATDIPDFEILRRVDEPAPGAFTYTCVFAMIQWGIFVTFALAVGYAAVHVARQHVSITFH